MTPGMWCHSTNTSETDAFDIFGDITFRVSPEFEIGVGARYSHDSKTTTLSSAVLNGLVMMKLAPQSRARATIERRM